MESLITQVTRDPRVSCFSAAVRVARSGGRHFSICGPDATSTWCRPQAAPHPQQLGATLDGEDVCPRELMLVGTRQRPRGRVLRALSWSLLTPPPHGAPPELSAESGSDKGAVAPASAQRLRDAGGDSPGITQQCLWPLANVSQGAGAAPAHLCLRSHAPQCSLQSCPRRAPGSAGALAPGRSSQGGLARAEVPGFVSPGAVHPWLVAVPSTPSCPGHATGDARTGANLLVHSPHQLLLIPPPSPCRPYLLPGICSHLPGGGDTRAPAWVTRINTCGDRTGWLSGGPGVFWIMRNTRSSYSQKLLSYPSSRPSIWSPRPSGPLPARSKCLLNGGSVPGAQVGTPKTHPAVRRKARGRTDS